MPASGAKPAALTAQRKASGTDLGVTAVGSRLLIDARTGCGGSNSLLWFNPGSHAEQWLLRAPAKAFGVLAVIPYYSWADAPGL